MKITPALPSPLSPTALQNRAAVGSVQAAKPAGDAAEEPQRHPLPVRAVDATGRERLLGPDDGYGPAAGGGTLRAHRALSAYQRVSASEQHSDLRRLLGFDAYA